MRKIIILLFIFFILLSCTKTNKQEKIFKKFNGYIKEMDVWAITDENDFGKKISDIRGKTNLLFGDEITIVNEKKINDMAYYRITVKDKKEQYWIRKDYTAVKFIVINKKDTPVYAIPDENYSIKAILQPGDFGILIKKEKDWFNVDFWAYRSRNESNKKEFIGNMWINKNSGFTDNILSAKQSYYLYYAYYYYYSENNIIVANNFIKKALSVDGFKNKKDEDDITPLIIEFKKILNNKSE